MHLTFIALLCIGLLGCASEDEASCPYSGGSFTCAQAAEKSIGGSGLCDSSRSVQALKSDCEGWDSAFRSCWTACTEKASTCAQATACESDCYSCGR